MGKQLLRQMFDSPRALAVTAGVMGLLGIVPGMPNGAFLTLAAVAGGAPLLTAVDFAPAVLPAVGARLAGIIGAWRRRARPGPQEGVLTDVSARRG